MFDGSVAARLRRALGDGRLEVHFQPQVELRTGAIIAVEALVRWRLRGGRLVMPGRFLPRLAPEQHDSLLEGVLQATAALASRLDAGCGLRFAVNVSGEQFERAGRLVQIVESHLPAFPAGALEIELTEQAPLPQAPLLNAVMGALQDRGVRLVLDDFGVGASNLETLSELLPLRKIKLDASFVRRIGSARGRAIVQSMLELARRLELEVVAEGVQSAMHRDALLAAGCHAAQGEHFWTPLEGEAFLRVLARQRAGRPAAG